MSPVVDYCEIYAAVVTRRVKRSLALCFCMFVLLLAGGPLSQTRAGASELTPPMNAGKWSNTIAVTTFDGRLYSIEKSGALYRTDLTTGQWVQLGKADFANTRFLFSDPESLFTVETDGSLYRVSPANGSWNRMGEAGAWKNTIALVVLNKSLYSIEESGALYRTDLSSGRWVQLGKPEFAKTGFIFADGQNLYTIEADGSLYRVSPTNGTWMMVGSAGAWKGTFSGTTLNGRIYTVEQSGALYETNPATGTWKVIGRPEFGKTEFMFGANASLYSIDNGDLYRINPTSGARLAIGK